MVTRRRARRGPAWERSVASRTAFEIYSGAENGTVLWARLDAKPELRASRDHELELGVVRVAAPGEQVCGDDWATVDRDGLTFRPDG